jgi:hypothetical protein
MKGRRLQMTRAGLEPDGTIKQLLRLNELMQVLFQGLERGQLLSGAPDQVMEITVGVVEDEV